MFDADTITLMAGAPTLEGMDLTTLPQRLTDAYASIIAARMRLRQAVTTSVNLPDNTALIVGEMRRLAYANEAFVSALPERNDRAAAAFVAGAAHHVGLLAERISRTEQHSSRLGYQGISPEVSATLLFLVAEASADAAEMAKAIVIESDDPVERTLLAAVHNLANGRLDRLLSAEIPEGFLATDQTTQGVRSLYYMLLHGVRGLAAQVLGQDVTKFSGPFAFEPRALFEQVKALCVEPLGDVFEEDGTVSPSSLFPGPMHMASLLSAVSRDLASSALATLPPPDGIEQEPWSRTMQEIAHHRPYLWRNHRQAIEAGYLERGTSCVISFPTGAGKSTLSELKIAAILLRQEKVVFLAPTLALVDQTSKALKKTFPGARIGRERDEELLLDLQAEEMPEIFVMTPEQCLTLLSFSRDVFADVGLLVFDECHLLHPRDLTSSRRAVDAMLCVLNFTTVAHSADLLFLSAMMMNAQQIANWLQSITQRPCLALELTWKPTRQVRGCVVYDADQILALQTRLRQVRATVNLKDAPVGLRRELAVQAFGLFCLRQTWQTTERNDYALLPLLDESVLLTTGTAKDRTWYLTPNGNQVAASIAAATAAQGLKTLVFTQSIPLSNAAVKNLSHQLGRPDFVLTDEERVFYESAREDMGAASHLYLEIGEHYRATSSAIAHHGLLLPAERSLHESLFRRPDGINVIVATSTLAQGMNLPSEVVIIAADSRFDPETDRLQQLEAHELLNAAGRAGRAGESSYGFVLVVPSKVVYFDNTGNRIQSHWGVLQAIFSQSDQCIEIEDPLTPLLDQLHTAAGAHSTTAQYFIRRLPMSGTEEDDSDAPARDLLRRSLGAFVAQQRNDQEWIETRIAAALAARRADPEASEVLTWADRLAAAAGVSVGVVREIGDWLDGQPANENATVNDWRDAMFVWLEQRPALIPSLFRRESLEGLLGTGYKRLEDDAARGGFALHVLKSLLQEWMAGGTLADLERSFGTPEPKLGKCEAARVFVLRVVPDLAYVFGLPGQIVRARVTDPNAPEILPLSLQTLDSCVREGFDRPEKFALRIIRGVRLSRAAIHREFDQLSSLLGGAPKFETFPTLIKRVGRAVRTYDGIDDLL
jgi:superfamily II DNA/RNA helicase